MKKRSTMFIFMVVTVLFSMGCTVKVNETAIRPNPALEDHEGLRIVPLRHIYPPSQGVSFPESEQFLLCKKELCPIESGFTPVSVPVPIEEPAHVKPGIGNPEIPVHTTVYFANGSAVLEAEARTALDRLLVQIEGMDPSNLRIVIAGYTDSTGSKEINTALARDRSEAVVSYLRERGLHPRKMVAGGRPLCCYVAPNTTAEEQARNRRAEVWVEPAEEAGSEETH
jgi:outer membrane protein OmpA-like peptidoglycan-associated protein